MARGSISDSYTNIIHRSEVDGGWSGQLEIVVGTSNARGSEPFVFVDSDLLGPRRLVLTSAEAAAVAEALSAASATL